MILYQQNVILWGMGFCCNLMRKHTLPLPLPLPLSSLPLSLFLFVSLSLSPSPSRSLSSFLSPSPLSLPNEKLKNLRKPKKT